MTARRRLANISNHPSAGWGDAQREAALALCDAIVDVPFPKVPPAADEAEVERMARALVAGLGERPSAALVMGEYTLVAYLVPMLQARGIPCLVSTTERKVEAEGPGRKTALFEFVRFRSYPGLRLSETCEEDR